VKSGELREKSIVSNSIGALIALAIVAHAATTFFASDRYSLERVWGTDGAAATYRLDRRTGETLWTFHHFVDDSTTNQRGIESFLWLPVGESRLHDSGAKP
jgi:hypothetical protein